MAPRKAVTPSTRVLRSSDLKNSKNNIESQPKKPASTKNQTKNCVVVLNKAPAKKPASTKNQTKNSSNCVVVLNKSPLKEQKISSSPKKPVYKDSVVLNSSNSLQSEEETEKEHVFDFLSNSQSNGSDTDAATVAIIKELKKKGKITIKNRKKRKNENTKPPAAKKRKVLVKVKIPVLDPVELYISDDHDYESQPTTSKVVTFTSNHDLPSTSKQAAARDDQRRVVPLQNPIVQKLKGLPVIFNSTPVKRADLPSFNDSIISPIQKSTPWRVENLKVPNIFNFHRTSDLTPSYSSDVIRYDRDSIKVTEIVKNSPVPNNSDMENVNPNISVEKSPTKNIIQRTPLKELNLQNLTSPKRKQIRRETKFFGFDVGDDDDDSSMFGNQENVFQSNNSTLKEKLSALKNIKLVKPTRIDARITHDVFKSPEKPIDIRKAIMEVPVATKNIDFDEELPEELEFTTVDLFSDPEQVPEKVPEKVPARRSYTRVPKRKYNDSDEEEEEEEEVVEKKPRKKRNAGQNLAQKKELNQFVHEFNSMCEDVETYDLCVE